MGVAVLNPQDFLKNPSSQQALILPPPKMKVLKPAANSNPKPNRNNRNRAKRSSLQSKNDLYQTRPASASTVKPQVKKPVMGQVKILKRGEHLMNTPDRASKAVKEVLEKSDMCTTVLFGPKPELIPTEKVAGLYAGSSMFVASPPPSSVPLPAFLKTITIGDATSDLRRILRLDLP